MDARTAKIILKRMMDDDFIKGVWYGLGYYDKTFQQISHNNDIELKKDFLKEITTALEGLKI